MYSELFLVIEHNNLITNTYAPNYMLACHVTINSRASKRLEVIVLYSDFILPY